MELNKEKWIASRFTSFAPSFEKIQESLDEKGISISPKDYINACRSNNLIPDIDPIYVMIDEGTATLDDVNLVLEDVASAVADRIKRRTRKSPTAGHISHSGHQSLSLPNLSGRTTPKRKRSDHTQKHGRSKHGHDKSTRTQQRASRVAEHIGATDAATTNSTRDSEAPENIN